MNAMSHLRTLGALSALALVLGVSATPAEAQIGGRIRQGLGRVTGGRVSLDQLVGGNHPITTSLEHARWAVDSLDNFTPRESVRSMLELQRTPNGGFVLQPGYWEMHTQSYCLKAGTHGPGGGDGYLYAPPMGPAEDAVVTILRNSVNHPEIPQHDIQTLLWAIIARAKFEDLSMAHRAVASRLLTPQQLTSLNRSALDLIPGDEMGAMMARVPGPIRQVVEAENQLRQLVTDPDRKS